MDSGATLKIMGPLTIANDLLIVSGSSSTTYSYLDSYGVNDWKGGIDYASGPGAAYLYLYAYSGSLEIDGNIAGGSNSTCTPRPGG